MNESPEHMPSTQTIGKGDRYRKLATRATIFGTKGSPATMRAHSNLTHILDELGVTLASVETCDILEDPGRAFKEGILATPTLVLEIPGTGKKLRIAGALDNATSLKRAIQGLNDFAQ